MKPTEEFIQKANIKHNYKYDYEKSVYKNNREKIIIICHIHGEFIQIPINHLKGCGCPKCNKGIKSTLEEFINEANRVHNYKYDYSKSIYINAKTKIIIICPEHGEFKQGPDIHLSSCGCIKCANETMNYDKRDTWENFTNEAHIVHNNKYDYFKFIYKNRRTKGIIICLKHGEFLQNPGVHLSGKGCPTCGLHVGISKICKEWLDSFNNPNILREKPIKIGNRRFVPDGYDPKTNTVYEINGDFWHGNPEVFDLDKLNPVLKVTFRKLYEKTLEKEKIYKENGFIVVSIWENDWKKQKKKNK
jgi:hypothetical protein